MILLLVMLSLLSGGSTEVVQNFEMECGEFGDFFYYGIAPTVLYDPEFPERYTQICQTLYDTQYYATLYDTTNKIPVYSAYVFEGWMDCRRKSYWYIEPQLEDNNQGINMERWDRWVTYQASNEDYRTVSNIFDKGHLAPVYQANSQGCSDATFTLTNAAPQYRSFNRGQWKKVENDMASTVEGRCEDSTAFIVTGVVPGNNVINNRVSVPSHFWTAYCCKELITNRLISGGVIGVNSEDNVTPHQRSVKRLERRLKYLYNVQSFSLFYDGCRNAYYVPVTIPKQRRPNISQHCILSSMPCSRHKDLLF
ncbi:endonuclease domain-containing 1 protein-like [Paramisgurnus dabryanus]|uniref:endonuclease domain-containing 1 protein-like n=1 Tax=Paramisgurnus dabryanus TaxID=90735 RepID=UPI0031F3C8DD